MKSNYKHKCTNTGVLKCKANSDRTKGEMHVALTTARPSRQKIHKETATRVTGKPAGPRERQTAPTTPPPEGSGPGCKTQEI
jgi:hypothetical protein